MARLRKSDCSFPGIVRRRRGKGFSYADESGEPIGDEDTVARVCELAIPPAWKDVWICSDPMGHIQATGFDAAGRKQYRYHQRWHERQGARKFDEMVDFARALPTLRERVKSDLEDQDGLTRTRVLACAVRLLDIGFFRIGTEEYAEANETFGLATIRKEHMQLGEGPEIAFDYPAKSGRRMVRAVLDPEVRAVLEPLKRRRGGGPELLAYKAGRRWRDVKSGDINAYIKDVTGGDFSAKDFRTWNATVLAAVALAVSGRAPTSKRARARVVTRAVKEVAHYLANTPAVCRASYIDPRVIDRFEDGYAIAVEGLAEGEGLGEPGMHPSIEAAVIDLIEDDRSSDALEKVA